MSNNRYNKPVPDYTPKKKEKVEEPTMSFEPCCVCKKNVVDGYYSHWGKGGVCSRVCDIIREHQEPTQVEMFPVSSFNGHIFKGE